MDYVDSLLERSGGFASDGFNSALKMMPSKKALIIGCVDPRVDPADIFRLEAGEAAVIRNAGGRVNPALIETLAILRAVGKAATGNAEPELNLIVLHHTDCGIKHCYHHAPDLLAHHMGVASADLDELTINDPYKSVAVDIEALRANPNISGAYTVSGLVYDVATGKVETVVPPQRLRSEGN